MARLARVVVAHIPHHVTQRGNRRMTTFFGDDDYAAYKALIAEHCARHGVRVWAWCLMPNHVHLILVPRLTRTRWRRRVAKLETKLGRPLLPQKRGRRPGAGRLRADRRRTTELLDGMRAELVLCPRLRRSNWYCVPDFCDFCPRFLCPRFPARFRWYCVPDFRSPISATNFII